MSRLSDTLTAKAVELGISQTELAERTGVLQQSISALFNGDVASPRKWREIARELQIPESEMREMMIEASRATGKTTRLPRTFKVEEAFHEVPHRVRVDMTEIPAPIRPGKLIPVLGEAAGGADGRYWFNGNVIDYVACPPSLDGVPGAYAIYVDGESMSPRYRPGEVVWVHPHKPARRGDDVIIQIRPKEEGETPYGFIKEYVGWSGNRLTLRQHNPESQLTFDRDEVVSVHPIVLAGKY
ncbi:LexA family transcriptional regulator [Rhizobium leucaenae]|uniref:LexA family transcriptional regulator n=1 Tax=Rhizobium leucaenae TaxID=29450 RepID=UPI00161A2340|nr:helix-turn-helix domain-containing protein [Rhizobium leucaenae]MBB6299957.1 phage repressor protein C with HTH and peptisase S24 domain [Rhizobium leucaenae]